MYYEVVAPITTRFYEVWCRELDHTICKCEKAKDAMKIATLLNENIFGENE